MYALGLVEGFIESIALDPDSPDQTAAREVLEAVAVVDAGIKKATSQMVSDDALKTHLKMLLADETDA
jgi:hypothetical protein